MSYTKLEGPRFELAPGDSAFPAALRAIANPPKRLYGIGDPSALAEGLAVSGARRATPYGRAMAARFAALATDCGIAVISGGARGCDVAAHEAALAHGGRTVAFLGSSCAQPYPSAHIKLFQRIVDCGGAVVSEQGWEVGPAPVFFRMRNRLITGLARAMFVVEAGLPSETLAMAESALGAGKAVWAVPGAITSASSRGANFLIREGARPIVDDGSFSEALAEAFGGERGR